MKIPPNTESNTTFAPVVYDKVNKGVFDFGVQTIPTLHVTFVYYNMIGGIPEYIGFTIHYIIGDLFIFLNEAFCQTCI